MCVNFTKLFCGGGGGGCPGGRSFISISCSFVFKIGLLGLVGRVGGITQSNVPPGPVQPPGPHFLL